MDNTVIREKLLARRSSLLVRYRDGRDRADEELAELQPEVIENSTDQWDARVISRLGDADVAALGDVMAALVRLEAGSYGVCVLCEEKIPHRRLEALPETSTCVRCASLQQRGVVQDVG